MKCLNCENELNNRQKSFCCTRCRNEFYNKTHRVKIKCGVCGKYFECKKSSKKIFCSQKCSFVSRKGKIKTKEHRDNISKAQKNKAFKKEGSFKCDRCGVVFNSNTSLRAHKAHCGHFSRCFCGVCGKELSNRAALSNHVKLKHEKPLSSDFYRKMGKNGLESKSYLNTNIEVKLIDFFKNNDILFKEQYQIGNYWHLYDFYLPEYNCLIEADGDYWHGKKTPNEKWVKKRNSIDKVVSDYAYKKGYCILRFWGTDIENNINKVLGEILNGKNCKKRISRTAKGIRYWGKQIS